MLKRTLGGHPYPFRTGRVKRKLTTNTMQGTCIFNHWVLQKNVPKFEAQFRSNKHLNVKNVSSIILVYYFIFIYFCFYVLLQCDVAGDPEYL